MSVRGTMTTSGHSLLFVQLKNEMPTRIFVGLGRGPKDAWTLLVKDELPVSVHFGHVGWALNPVAHPVFDEESHYRIVRLSTIFSRDDDFKRILLEAFYYLWPDDVFQWIEREENH